MSVIYLTRAVLEVKGHFSQFHHWNIQMSLTADDKLLQALVWAQLAPSVSPPFLSLCSSSSYTSSSLSPYSSSLYPISHLWE